MRFRERLWVPAAWWLLAAGLAVSVLLAVGLSAGPVWGIVATALTVLVAVALFLGSALRIEVDDAVLRVGRAVIEHRYIGAVAPLDADRARRRADAEADARAHLVLRPYVRTAVEITLDDPDDPVPYWLLSTRRPAALAAALEGARRPDRSVG